MWRGSKHSSHKHDRRRRTNYSCSSTLNHQHARGSTTTTNNVSGSIEQNRQMYNGTIESIHSKQLLKPSFNHNGQMLVGSFQNHDSFGINNAQKSYFHSIPSNSSTSFINSRHDNQSSPLLNDPRPEVVRGIFSREQNATNFLDGFNNNKEGTSSFCPELNVSSSSIKPTMHNGRQYDSNRRGNTTTACTIGILPKEQRSSQQATKRRKLNYNNSFVPFEDGTVTGHSMVNEGLVIGDSSTFNVHSMNRHGARGLHTSTRYGNVRHTRNKHSNIESNNEFQYHDRSTPRSNRINFSSSRHSTKRNHPLKKSSSRHEGERFRDKTTRPFERNYQTGVEGTGDRFLSSAYYSSKDKKIHQHQQPFLSIFLAPSSNSYVDATTTSTTFDESFNRISKNSGEEMIMMDNNNNSIALAPSQSEAYYDEEREGRRMGMGSSHFHFDDEQYGRRELHERKDYGRSSGRRRTHNEDKDRHDSNRHYGRTMKRRYGRSRSRTSYYNNHHYARGDTNTSRKRDVESKDKFSRNYNYYEWNSNCYSSSDSSSWHDDAEYFSYNDRKYDRYSNSTTNSEEFTTTRRDNEEEWHDRRYLNYGKYKYNTDHHHHHREEYSPYDITGNRRRKKRSISLPKLGYCRKIHDAVLRDDQRYKQEQEQRHHHRRRDISPRHRNVVSRKERLRYRDDHSRPRRRRRDNGSANHSLPSTTRCSMSYHRRSRSSVSYFHCRSDSRTFSIPKSYSRSDNNSNRRWRRSRPIRRRGEEKDKSLSYYGQYNNDLRRSEGRRQERRDYHRRHAEDEAEEEEALSNHQYVEQNNGKVIMSDDEDASHDHNVYDDDDELRDDDKVGHFKGGRGALVGLHYEIIRDLGTGTFGRVVECKDRRYANQRSSSSSTKTVAIKIVRDVKRYYESAQIEGDILEAVNSLGGRGKSLCVQLLDRFDIHNRFYCLTFERLGKSLYEFLKSHDFIPFPLYCVRDFAYQLLDALDFLHQPKLKLVHTDLKPENILLVSNDETSYYCGDTTSPPVVVPSSTKIKIIDFGGATYDNEKKSSIINTRQYRAPEVILGLYWSLSSDLWSLGCILSELYTGDLLFATHDNKEHLALIEQCVGKFPKKMLEHSNLGRQTFDLKSCMHRRLSLTSSSLMHVERMLPLKELLKKQDQESGLLELLQSLLTIDPDPNIRISPSKAKDLHFCRNNCV